MACLTVGASCSARARMASPDTSGLPSAGRALALFGYRPTHSGDPAGGETFRDRSLLGHEAREQQVAIRGSGLKAGNAATGRARRPRVARAGLAGVALAPLTGGPPGTGSRAGSRAEATPGGCLACGRRAFTRCCLCPRSSFGPALGSAAGRPTDAGLGRRAGRCALRPRAPLGAPLAGIGGCLSGLRVTGVRSGAAACRPAVARGRALLRGGGCPGGPCGRRGHLLR